MDVPSRDSEARPVKHPWLAPRVWGCALLLVGLDAIKPATVDDPAILRQAMAWAAHPGDPWSGVTPLYQALVPMRSVALPPVGVAWLALGVALFGPVVWALKLMLLPFALLLVDALDRLLARVAPTLAPAILAMVVLSPWMLPSLNLMLDLPALALGLTALALLAAERVPDARRAIAAGVLAGLALQTKYTVAPLVLSFALIGRPLGRVRATWIALAAAAATFGAIEAALALFAGGSPLVAYVAGRGARDPEGHHPLLTARKLMFMAGSVGAGLIPLGLLAWRATARAAAGAALVIALAFAAFAWAPPGWVTALNRLTGGRIVNFDNLTLGLPGPWLVGLAAAAGAAAWRAGREPAGSGATRAALLRAIALWLAVECLVAPAVSASASVRRLLGALTALGILLAGLVERRAAADVALRRAVTTLAGLGVLLGLAYALVDLDSAASDARVFDAARERAGGARGTAYVVDHWGAFPWLAERAGLSPVALGHASLEAGDRLLVSFDVEMRGVRLDPSHVVSVDSIPLRFRAPVTTRRAFYDGRVALRRPDPGWMGVRVDSVIEAGEALEPAVPAAARPRREMP